MQALDVSLADPFGAHRGGEGSVAGAGQQPLQILANAVPLSQPGEKIIKLGGVIFQRVGGLGSGQPSAHRLTSTSLTHSHPILNKRPLAQWRVRLRRH
jgi:hypothetical protein